MNKILEITKTWVSKYLNVVIVIIVLIITMSIMLPNTTKKGKNKVLIIRTLGIDELDDSFGVECLKKALKTGGQIKITTFDIMKFDPKFEDKYAISNIHGTYLINGAVINFVVDHGWKFKSMVPGNLIFIKE